MLSIATSLRCANGTWYVTVLSELVAFSTPSISFSNFWPAGVNSETIEFQLFCLVARIPAFVSSL